MIWQHVLRQLLLRCGHVHETSGLCQTWDVDEVLLRVAPRLTDPLRYVFLLNSLLELLLVKFIMLTEAAALAGVVLATPPNLLGTDLSKAVTPIAIAEECHQTEEKEDSHNDVAIPF